MYESIGWWCKFSDKKGINNDDDNINKYGETSEYLEVKKITKNPKLIQLLWRAGKQIREH